MVVDHARMISVGAPMVLHQIVVSSSASICAQTIHVIGLATRGSDSTYAYKPLRIGSSGLSYRLKDGDLRHTVITRRQSGRQAGLEASETVSRHHA